jgi:hypothetical protein
MQTVTKFAIQMAQSKLSAMGLSEAKKSELESIRSGGMLILLEILIKITSRARQNDHYCA